MICLSYIEKYLSNDHNQFTLPNENLKESSLDIFDPTTEPTAAPTTEPTTAPTADPSSEPTNDYWTPPPVFRVIGDKPVIVIGWPPSTVKP